MVTSPYDWKILEWYEKLQSSEQGYINFNEGKFFLTNVVRWLGYVINSHTFEYGN